MSSAVRPGAMQPYLGAELRPGLDEIARPGRVVYRGEVLRLHPASLADGSWIRATVSTDDDLEIVCVGRELPEVKPGCMVRLAGYWDEHPEHGPFFAVTECLAAELPERPEGVVRYLAATIRGCGEERARRIVDALGVSAIDVLLHDPESVRRVYTGRVGANLVAALAEWAPQASADRAATRITMRLLAAGVTYKMARRIVSYFRTTEAAEIAALRDPYRLLDLPEIGWKRADAIARKLGVHEDDPGRLHAAVAHALGEAMRQGHSCLPPQDLVHRATQVVGHALAAQVPEALTAALEDSLVEEGGVVYRQEVLLLEWRVAAVIARLVARDCRLHAEERTAVDAVLATTQLTGEQRDAVLLALESGCSVLTGRPGAGKTTTTAAYLRCCEALGWSVDVAAPTGKAASRAKAVTGVNAQTIHRLLATAPGQLRPEPLDSDVLLLDEASMCSLEIVAWLLANVDPARTRVLLCGDADQLPSVEHGAVLRDVLASELVPAARLTRIWRQQIGSRIVAVAHALLDGQQIDLDAGGDFVFREIAEGATAPTDDARALLLVTIGDLAAQGVDVRRDLQVLSPKRAGPVGVTSLNVLLQDVLNRDGEVGPPIGGGACARVGDRVIQQRNDYKVGEAGIFNGEQGVVIAVDRKAESVTVRLETDSTVTLSGVQRYNLHLAWAVTVHRSQGSEYPYVILLYDHRAHAGMLDIGLLYTAVTRAKRGVVLIGSRKAVDLTQRRERHIPRYSGLAEQIRLAIPTDPRSQS